MRRFQREMDRFFGRRGLDLPVWPAPAVSYPAVNVWEDDDFDYAGLLQKENPWRLTPNLP
jgi:hypothetical protein